MSYKHTIIIATALLLLILACGIVHASAENAGYSGVHWNKTTDTFTRLGDATQQSDFDNLYPWCDIVRVNLNDNGTETAVHGDPNFKYDGSNGQVMVRIPQYYYNVEYDEDGISWCIWHGLDNMPVDYKPFLVQNGMNINRVYIGAFEACSFDVSGGGEYNTADAAGVDFTVGTGDKLASIAGAKPLSGLNNSLSLPNARKLAQNRGAWWQLSTYQQVSALQMLYLVEYANWDSQTQIGAGVTNITDDALTNMAINTGYTAGVGEGAVDLGNASGQSNNITHYQTGQTTKAMSYRGVENFYGNIWTWVDGINIKADNKPWVADHDYASDLFSHPYNDTGLTLKNANGYVSDIALNANHDYGFLASEVTGSSTTKLCDFYYQAAGNRAALMGGSWLHGAYAGAFTWSLSHAASYVDRSIGARLAYIGIPTASINATTISGVEGENITLQINLDRPTPDPVSITVTTTDGTAYADVDYVLISETVTIPEDGTTGTFVVHLIDDRTQGADKTFTIALSSPVNATLANSVCTVTIIDNGYNADTDQANKLFSLGWVLVLMAGVTVVFVFLGGLFLLARNGNFSPTIMFIVIAGGIVVGLSVIAIVLLGYVSGEIINALRVFEL